MAVLRLEQSGTKPAYARSTHPSQPACQSLGILQMGLHAVRRLEPESEGVGGNTKEILRNTEKKYIKYGSKMGHLRFIFDVF